MKQELRGGTLMNEPDGGITVRFWKTSIQALLVLVLAALLVLPAAPGFAAGGDVGIVRLDILSVNDFHGALAEAGKNPGAAKLGGYLVAEKAKNPGGTLVLSAGDMLQGTPDSNMVYGRAVVQVMNVVGFDAMAIGNHEFDWGIDCLKQRIGEAKFPVLSANIVDNNSGKPVDFAQPAVIIEKNGVKVGIIGITTPEAAYTTSPKVVGGYTFGEPATVVNAMVPVLRSQGAQVIVVLAHLSSDMDKSGRAIGDAAVLANAVEGVDVIVSAHSHRKVADIVNGVAVVQGYYNGRDVGKVSLAYSLREGRVIAKTAEAVDMIPDKLKPSPVIQAIVAQNEAGLRPIKSVVLGRTASELTHDKMQLSVLGQWTTDAMRETAAAEIAFNNGGGLRTSIPAGEITMGNLYEVMPFDNTLVTMDLTGAQIMEILNYGINNAQLGSLQYSGLKVVYDGSRPQGQRVVDVTLLDGRKLELSATYKVVTNDFMAVGGDNYTTFKQGKNVTDTFMLLRDVFVDAVKKAKIIDVKADDRLSVTGASMFRTAA